MSGAAQILAGGGIGAVVAGGPAWFLIRANRGKVRAGTARDEAETNSVIVATADRLVDIVNRQMEGMRGRMEAVEGENRRLSSEHRDCVNYLREMHEDLERSEVAMSTYARALDRLRDQGVAWAEQRRVMTGQIADLTAQVVTLRKRVGP